MNYELAKKLKEAGYPQEYNPKYDIGGGSAPGSDIRKPSLSELIEACGDRIWSITRHGNIWQTNFKDGMGGESSGSTPEEAVTNLWLELNKK